MKLGSLLLDLLTPLDTPASIDEGLARTLRRIVKSTGAVAGALVVCPARQPPIRVIVGASGPSRTLRSWAARRGPGTLPGGLRRRTVGAGRAGAVFLEARLGPPRAAVGALALIGPPARPRAAVLPPG